MLLKLLIGSSFLSFGWWVFIVIYVRELGVLFKVVYGGMFYLIVKELERRF